MCVCVWKGKETCSPMIEFCLELRKCLLAEDEVMNNSVQVPLFSVGNVGQVE